MNKLKGKRKKSPPPAASITVVVVAIINRYLDVCLSLWSGNSDKNKGQKD